MNKNELEALKNLLWTKTNQQKMLNNTLLELINKNGLDSTIVTIQKELNETMKEIHNIKNDINALEWENNSCVHNDEEKKNSESMYDNVEKKENDYGGYLQKSFIEEFKKSIDNRIMSNRFIVHLNDALYIPETMVKSAYNDTYDNTFMVTIYDFVATKFGKKIPIIQVLKDRRDMSFSFTVEHLSCEGTVLYRDYYNKCSFKSICPSGLDYSKSDFSTININIAYDNVTHEAAN